MAKSFQMPDITPLNDLRKRLCMDPLASEDIGTIGSGDDMGEHAFRTETMELNGMLMQNQGHIRMRVLEASERVREGLYGLCMGCEKRIPKARLQAIPYAVNCVKCEEKAGG